MKSLIIFSFLNLICIFCKAQDFEIDKHGHISTSIEDFINGEINATVSINDIFYPDSGFSCLKALGEPKEINSEKTTAGLDYEIIYEDFIIYYSNVMSGDALELVLIEFLSGQSFLQLKDKNVKIGTNKPLSDQLSSTNFSRLRTEKNKPIQSIFFSDYETARMSFETKNSRVIKVKFYF